MARWLLSSLGLGTAVAFCASAFPGEATLTTAPPGQPPIPHITVPNPVHVAPRECAPLVQFDTIAASVTLNFYDHTFRGLPWARRVEQFRRRIRCSDGPDRIAAVANSLFGLLKASHTGVYTADDLSYWALESIFSQSIDDYRVAYVGIWPRRYSGRWFARYVLQGSPAADAGVLPGDELISIDGKPYRPLGFRAGASAILIVSEDGRSRRAMHIVPAVQSMQRFLLIATRDSEHIYQIQARAVGYFHLWTGTNPLFLSALNHALTDFEQRHVAALVLDLRGGYGGTSLTYLQRLKEDPYLKQLPKLVLIDDGTRSGKELVAGTIKYEHLARLVGTRTAGAFLGGAPVRLFNNRYLVEVAIGHFTPPGIGEIEGVGVQPDIEVPPCIQFCRGRDPQLSAALHMVQRDLRSSR